jgi:LysR family glycine cleavage system transcriptional activator
MKSYLPPLKSLHFFSVAARSENFKFAAERLNVTQAAVSQQIKLLEQFVNMPLFERNNRQTKLTNAGQRLLPFVESGFTSFRQGLNAIGSDPKPNVLRVSAIHSFSTIWLLPRLLDFQESHPHLLVQIAPSNDLVNFDDDEIDLAIRMGEGGYAGLNEKRLFNDKLILVASPSIIPECSKHDASLIFSKSLIQDPSRQTQIIFRGLCNKYNVDADSLTPSIVSSDSMTLIENALAGRGYTFVNKSLVAEHLLKGELVQLLDEAYPSPWALHLVAPQHHFEWEKVQQFESWFRPLLQASFGDISAW